MSNRKETAAALHKSGYNCAQAVACTFADRVNLTEDELFRVMEGFGLGMGGTRGTCGAITGAVAIVSLLNSRGISDTANKGATYKIARQITQRFEEKNGVSLCHQLKGIETGTVARSCPGCIGDAVEILENVLEENFGKKTS